MVAISLGCGSRRGGCRGVGEDGHETVSLQSCASFVCGGVERVEHDVLVVSIDRLTHILRVAAGRASDARSAEIRE